MVAYDWLIQATGQSDITRSVSDVFDSKINAMCKRANLFVPNFTMYFLREFKKTFYFK